jgi:glucan phosphoethanolaminetransferase (alkaline phosphatase superfamily)
VTDHTREVDPQVYARTAGILYLIIILASGFAELGVRSRLIVSDDAVATAANILGHASLFRLSLAGEILNDVCDVALALVLYVLLRPVSGPLALLAAFFRLVSAALLCINKLGLFTALLLLEKSAYLEVFDARQRAALAYLAIESHGYGMNIGLVFYAFHYAVLGWLIYISRYLPKFLGILVLIAAACLMTSSFAQFLAPDLFDRIFPAIDVPAGLADLLLGGWLLVKGVDLPTWRARVALEGKPSPTR